MDLLRQRKVQKIPTVTGGLSHQAVTAKQQKKGRNRPPLVICINSISSLRCTRSAMLCMLSAPTGCVKIPSNHGARARTPRPHTVVKGKSFWFCTPNPCNQLYTAFSSCIFKSLPYIFTHHLKFQITSRPLRGGQSIGIPLSSLRFKPKVSIVLFWARADLNVHLPPYTPTHC